MCHLQMSSYSYQAHKSIIAIILFFVILFLCCRRRQRVTLFYKGVIFYHYSLRTRGTYVLGTRSSVLGTTPYGTPEIESVVVPKRQEKKRLRS